jgi:hypothetical protein
MRALVVACAALLAAAGNALAQDAASQPAWAPEIGGEVRVTAESGQRSVGHFRSIDADTLRLLVADQEVVVSRDAILRLERRGDSLTNGFVIGAAVGLIPAAFAIGEVEGGGNVAAAIVIGSGFYGLIGMGIDALHKGWTTVYERKAAKSGRRRQVWAAPTVNGMLVGYTRRF